MAIMPQMSTRPSCPLGLVDVNLCRERRSAFPTKLMGFGGSVCDAHRAPLERRD